MAGRLYILYGEDEPSASEALQAIKASLGPADAVQPNTVSFEGRSLTLGQMEMACNTVPFLTGSRLVIASGLLEVFEQRQQTRRGRAPAAEPAPESAPGRTRAGAPANAKKTKEEEWARLPVVVKAMPPTTVLVLLSGGLNARNSMLLSLRDLGEVRAFPLLQGPDLEAWISERARRYGGRITPNALRLLASFAGSDLRLLDNEVRKLCTYAGQRPVDEDMVGHLAIDTREASIFSLVDGVIEGRNAYVLRTLHQLMDEGGAGPYIITMLARQVRMLLQVKSLRESGAPASDIPRVLGTNSDFVVRKVQDQARHYSLEQLKALHRRLLEADLAFKEGKMREDLALETLVIDAASLRKV